jgi:hypothetical protein
VVAGGGKEPAIAREGEVVGPVQDQPLGAEAGDHPFGEGVAEQVGAPRLPGGGRGAADAGERQPDHDKECGGETDGHGSFLPVQGE